jgi:hypothetical protein
MTAIQNDRVVLTRGGGGRKHDRALQNTMHGINALAIMNLKTVPQITYIKMWSIFTPIQKSHCHCQSVQKDSLCGLVVRVLGYRSGGPGSIPGTTRGKSSGSETGSTQPRESN